MLDHASSAAEQRFGPGAVAGKLRNLAERLYAFEVLVGPYDVDREVALRRSLAVYRMVFGQPRQDDLLEFILREVADDRRDELAAALTIDLSPPS